MINEEGSGTSASLNVEFCCVSREGSSTGDIKGHIKEGLGRPCYSTGVRWGPGLGSFTVYLETQERGLWNRNVYLYGNFVRITFNWYPFVGTLKDIKEGSGKRHP